MTPLPTIGIATDPRFPPEMWAAMANAQRRGGNCSAMSALPTGCCGAPPTRETTLKNANGRKLVVNAIAAMAEPKTTLPAPRMSRRGT
jgi:hypothetical protein